LSWVFGSLIDESWLARMLLLLLLSILSMSVYAEKIAVIGAGSFGTSMAYKLSSQNPEAEVALWAFEELAPDGRNLTEVINADHVNSKYLPNVTLPATVRASSSLESVCSDATTLVLVVPHQFLEKTLREMEPYVNKAACAVSCTKGLSLSSSGAGGIELLSDKIQHILALQQPCAVLMGANVASDVSKDEFVEATVACKAASVARHIKSLFHSATLQIACVDDVFSVEVCGALKNVVALGAGFCDGLGLGSSTKAAVMRLGLQEMVSFCAHLHPDRLLGVDPRNVILESCGVGDVIASCIGGRNRACAAEFARRSALSLSFSPEAAATLWQEIESSLLHGQKLQGLGTCDEVFSCLEARPALRAKFPLFSRIHGIARLGWHPSRLVQDWSSSSSSSSDSP